MQSVRHCQSRFQRGEPGTTCGTAIRSIDVVRPSQIAAQLEIALCPAARGDGSKLAPQLAAAHLARQFSCKDGASLQTGCTGSCTATHVVIERGRKMCEPWKVD